MSYLSSRLTTETRYLSRYHIASVFHEVRQVKCMKLRSQTNSIIIRNYKRSPGGITTLQIASRHWDSFIHPCSWYGWIKYEEGDSWSDYEVVRLLFIAMHSESKRFFWYTDVTWKESPQQLRVRVLCFNSRFKLILLALSKGHDTYLRIILYKAEQDVYFNVSVQTCAASAFMLRCVSQKCYRSEL